MNKFFKYGLIAVGVILVGYNSVYIKKLSDVQKAMPGKFDAKAFVQELWNEKLPAKLDSAIDINSLRKSIETNADEAFSKYTNALAIGNYRYALVKGEATIDSVNEDDVSVIVQSEQPFKAAIVTEFVYGNTLRDASGLVNLKEFPNTSDLNNISEELNEIIRKKVVSSFKPNLKQGMKIEFTGAIQLNKEHVHFDDLEIVPVRIKMLP